VFPFKVLESAFTVGSTGPGYLPVVLRLQEVELLLDALQCVGDGELDWTLRWWSLCKWTSIWWVDHMAWEGEGERKHNYLTIFGDL